MTQATIAGAAAATVALLCLATAATAETVAPQAIACKPIRNAAQLQAIRDDLDGSYCLMNDIDAGSVANFAPIGGFFRGRLFGNGRVIRNLTINSDAFRVGLFGATDGALIQDIGLVNVNISGTAAGGEVGGLVGLTVGGTRTEIRRVHVTGWVAATGGSSTVGGIVGVAGSGTLANSWSSASVTGAAAYFAGGAVGIASSAISRVHATGPVTCGPSCDAGGLIGRIDGVATVDLSYASGPVATGDDGNAGGLIGDATGAPLIQRSHALGAVRTGAGDAAAGGLIGDLNGGSVTWAYAVGRVSGGAGATLGGLVGTTGGGGSVNTGYWDTITSGQAVSAAGTAGYTTAQLRNALPPGFSGSAWALTRNKSYPFLNEADIAFAAPLATLVKAGRVYTFLPAVQHDKSQYATPPANSSLTSLAAAYTMIARAVGVARNVARLKNVPIDTYWKDGNKTAVWRGPVTKRATLGTLKTIAANARLNNTNVIGEMRIGRLVLLRGTYTRSNGRKAEHWMLGTLYTTSGNAPIAVIANDPWTGLQVTIDPASKTIVWPTNFPLTGFKVNGYQPVTLN